MSCVERVTPSSTVSVTKCHESWLMSHDLLWLSRHDPDDDFAEVLESVNLVGGVEI